MLLRPIPTDSLSELTAFLTSSPTFHASTGNSLLLPLSPRLLVFSPLPHTPHSTWVSPAIYFMLGRAGPP